MSLVKVVSMDVVLDRLQRCFPICHLEPERVVKDDPDGSRRRRRVFAGVCQRHLFTDTESRLF